MMLNPLLDFKFLKELDNQILKTVYAKIISLDIEENPVEEIQGKITGGNINIDGNSAVRRTCNLTLSAAADKKFTSYYWSLRTKFKVFIGLENIINQVYPDIIWFPMGIYVITAFNYQHSVNNIIVTISGKDKMSLLNGDLSGVFPISVNLSEKQEIVATYQPGEPDESTDISKLYCNTDTGQYYKYDKNGMEWVIAQDTDLIFSTTKVELRELLHNLLFTFGNEQKQNIIINDLDEKAIELLTYREGESPLYYFKQAGEYENPTLDGDTRVWIKTNITNPQYYFRDSLVFFTLPSTEKNSPNVVWTKQVFKNAILESGSAPVAIKYLKDGMNLYLFTNKDKTKFCYAVPAKVEGDEILINLSENGIPLSFEFGSSLSQAVGQLTFHFDQAEEQLQGNKFEATSCYIDSIDSTPRTIFQIVGGETVGYRETKLTYPGELISSVGETVVSILDKIKKVFSDFEYFYDVNGKFIFQKKKIYLNTAYTPLMDIEGNGINVELLVDAAVEQYSFNNNNLFISTANTPLINNLRNDFSIWGTKKSNSGATVPFHMRYAIHNKPTYYKNYNGDIFCTNDEILSFKDRARAMIVDWREIIYQMALDYHNNYTRYNFTQSLIYNNKDFYPTGITGYETFYEDMIGHWRNIYNPSGTADEGFKEIESKNYFHDNVKNAPQQLTFWIDFLDTYGDINKYSIKNVGDRQKAANDNNITAIYYDSPPNVMFYDPNNIESQYLGSSQEFYVQNNGVYILFKTSTDIADEFQEFRVRSDSQENNLQETTNSDGYVYFQLPKAFEELFVISTQGKTAKNQIDEWLYNYAVVTENASINSSPVYYLQPNTIITVNDEEANIIGQYVINKLTYNFAYNGSMNISANKMIKRLY